jgi:hypothetical protein
VGAYVRMHMRTIAGSYRLTSGASFPPRLILWRLEVDWERLAAGRRETARAQVWIGGGVDGGDDGVECEHGIHGARTEVT